MTVLRPNLNQLADLRLIASMSEVEQQACVDAIKETSASVLKASELRSRVEETMQQG